MCPTLNWNYTNSTKTNFNLQKIVYVPCVQFCNGGRGEGEVRHKPSYGTLVPYWKMQRLQQKFHTLPKYHKSSLGMWLSPTNCITLPGRNIGPITCLWCVTQSIRVNHNPNPVVNMIKNAEIELRDQVSRVEMCRKISSPNIKSSHRRTTITSNKMALQDSLGKG